MREIAITAGVNVALPVIAKSRFCGSFPESQSRSKLQRLI
jgi:hypothetical protein